MRTNYDFRYMIVKCTRLAFRSFCELIEVRSLVMKLISYYFVCLNIAFVCAMIQSEHDNSKEVLLKGVITKFLENQECITIFSVDESKVFNEHKTYVIRYIQSIVSVIVYNRLSEGFNENKSGIGDELNVPSTTKGYIAIATSTKVMIEKLHLFSRINPNGKWTFAINAAEQKEVQLLLMVAWVKYNMANILVFFRDKYLNAFVTIYNPFAKNGEQRGNFWTSEINHNTISSVLEVLENNFENKVRDLQQFSIRASYYSDPSKANKILDLEMISVFEKVLNVKFSLFLPRDGKFMGTQKNGEFTGSLKDVEEGFTDIALNNRLLFPVNSTRCIFLDPVGSTSLKYVMLKKPRPVTRLHFNVIQVFDWNTRMLFFVTTAMLLFIWHLMNKLRKRIVKLSCQAEVMSDLFLVIVGIQSSVSVKLKLNLSPHQKMLILSLLASSLILCNAFQGAILKHLSAAKKPPDIDTLKDLIKSKIQLSAMVVIPNLFKPNLDESNVNKIQKQLYERQKVLTDVKPEQVYSMVNTSNMALLSELVVSKYSGTYITLLLYSSS